MSKELNPDITPKDLPKIYALLESEGALKAGRSYALPNQDDSEVYIPDYYFAPFKKDANDPCLRWAVISPKNLGDGCYCKVDDVRGLIKKTPDGQWHYKTQPSFVLKREVQEDIFTTLQREQSLSFSPPLKAKYSFFVFRKRPALLMRNAGDRSLANFLLTQYEEFESFHGGYIVTKDRQSVHFSMLERLEMARSLCKTLLSTHAEKVSINGQEFGTLVHRDLKPENIMLKGMEPTLIDRGLARGSKEVSQWSSFVGTPLYMDYVAPHKTLEPYQDEKSDIWSLGLILMEVFGDFHRHKLATQSDLNWDNDNISVDLDDLVRQFGVSVSKKERLVTLIRSCLNRDKDERPPLLDLIASFNLLIAQRKTFLKEIKVDDDWGSSILIELLKSEYADSYIESCVSAGLIDRRIELLGTYLLYLPPLVAAKLFKLGQPGCLKSCVSLQQFLDVCKDEANPETLKLAIQHGAVITDALLEEWVKSYNPQKLTPNWIRIARVLHDHSLNPENPKAPSKLAKVIMAQQQNNEGLALLFEQGILCQTENPDDLPMRIREHIRLEKKKSDIERRLECMEQQPNLNQELQRFFLKIKGLIAQSKSSKPSLSFFFMDNESYTLKAANDLFKTYRKLLADCKTAMASMGLPAYETLLTELKAYVTNDNPIDLAKMLRQFKEHGRQLQLLGRLKPLARYSSCLNPALREELEKNLKESKVADLLAHFNAPVYQQLGECLTFYCCDLPEIDGLKSRCENALLSLNSLDSESVAPVYQQICQWKEMVLLEKATREMNILGGFGILKKAAPLAQTATDAERLHYWKRYSDITKQWSNLKKGLKHKTFCPEFRTVYGTWLNDFSEAPKPFSFDANTLATIDYFFKFILAHKPSAIERIKAKAQDFLAGKNDITLQNLEQEYARVVTIVRIERKVARELAAMKKPEPLSTARP